MSRRTALLLALLPAWPVAAAAQDWHTVTAARAYGGEERLEVDVEYGAGHFRLAAAEPSTLYRTSLRYDAERSRPTTDYEPGRLRVSLERSGRSGWFRNRDGPSRLDLALGGAVPLDLDLRFGAAEADLELGGLRLDAVSIATGASKTELRFSRPNPERCRVIDIDLGAASFEVYGLGNANAEELRLDGGAGEIVLDFTGVWNGDMSAEIDIGMAGLTLQLPRGLGVRVTKDSFFAPFDSQGFVKRGDAFYSEDWDGAEHRLMIDVDAAFGSIDVRWVDGSDAVL